MRFHETEWANATLSLFIMLLLQNIDSAFFVHFLRGQLFSWGSICDNVDTQVLIFPEHTHVVVQNLDRKQLLVRIQDVGWNFWDVFLDQGGLGLTFDFFGFEFHGVELDIDVPLIMMNVSDPGVNAALH